MTNSTSLFLKHLDVTYHLKDAQLKYSADDIPRLAVCLTPEHMNVMNHNFAKHATLDLDVQSSIDYFIIKASSTARGNGLVPPYTADGRAYILDGVLVVDAELQITDLFICFLFCPVSE